ncbi:MAG: rhodanese-like domain-containing protein [Chloroflexota bacterium]
MVKLNAKNMMGLVFSAGLVCGLALAVGCAVSKSTAPGRVIETITPQQAASLIEDNRNNPDFVILDVRTPGEFAAGHLAGAVNLDFYASTFRDDVNKLDKTRSYLVYCHSGNRSGQAVTIMDELGFGQVYNLSSGIEGWLGQGLPTVK